MTIKTVDRPGVFTVKVEAARSSYGRAVIQGICDFRVEPATAVLFRGNVYIGAGVLRQTNVFGFERPAWTLYECAAPLTEKTYERLDNAITEGYYAMKALGANEGKDEVNPPNE